MAGGKWQLVGFTCLLGVAGCGVDPLPGTGTAVNGASSRMVSSVGTCDPNRSLRLVVVFDGTTLERPIDTLNLAAGFRLPPFDPSTLGVDAASAPALNARIVSAVRAAYAPFGIEVTGDDVAVDANTEVVSRVILTQVEGGPSTCRCQGATGELGLSIGGTAEGIVLANAFRANGLATALERRSAPERVERLAAALSNSIVHEAGHTFGLVHIDVPGAPTLFMARGGSSQSFLSLAQMSTVQDFSSEWVPVTADAAGVRTEQCDTCLLTRVIEQRRFCDEYPSTR